ncbi:hypothetical protein HUB90_05505 [Wolbachia endosymbiont of Kradibia gibbosae]|uniref:hypothetical protein n=1 Tax=Wolbachia endosymbiont of Kradibia gibbosae TaxID=2742716 RepID=UPI0018D643A3|nr:hypothetical protein [Wolbachia endosymbiont of Kradibia gibbosae]MBH5362468.1 hypothetical protein [Wolbachia endosymbiont of Kradibia gibbosae]
MQEIATTSYHREPSYRDSFHNCTNVAIWAYQKGVMKVADTGSFMTVSSQCPDYLDPGNLIASNALGLVSMGFAL